MNRGLLHPMDRQAAQMKTQFRCPSLAWRQSQTVHRLLRRQDIAPRPAPSRSSAPRARSHMRSTDLRVAVLRGLPAHRSGWTVWTGHAHEAVLVSKPGWTDGRRRKVAWLWQNPADARGTYRDPLRLSHIAARRAPPPAP